MTNEKNVPLPMEIAFKRMNLKTDDSAIEKRLATASVSSHLLQDYVPLYESLEWELSKLYWKKRGVLPFVENDVPFIINNSGRLSLQSAQLLFNQCQSLAPTGKITLLEMGAGTGLFARYLLDAFKGLCEQECSDYFDRIQYYVTDYSRTTVAHWQERGIFADHKDQVILATCDGLKPGKIKRIDGAVASISDLDMVFCNYMLDILPSTVVMKKDHVLHELHVRTQLNKTAEHNGTFANLSLQDIRELAGQKDSESRSLFSALMDSIEFQSQYRPVEDGLEKYESILNKMGSPDQKLLLNHGALQCLEQCLELLKKDGIILINDYGPSNQEEMMGFGPAQRFGSTIAHGLNFPMLKQYFDFDGFDFFAPEGNGKAAVQCRILTRSASNQMIDGLNAHFGRAASERYDQSLLEARDHQTAGRKNEALKAYHQALLDNRQDWTIAGEIAEFLVLQIQDFQAGVEVAQHAIKMNPWYNAWLWNILGDGLYCMGQIEEAHEAYLQAERIDEKDPRTNLNLAYTYYQKGRHGNALKAVACGLTHDAGSQYRGRLLEKQQQILAAISGVWLSRQEHLINRSERLR